MVSGTDTGKKSSGNCNPRVRVLALIIANSGVQAGLVIWQTSMSPFLTSSNSSMDDTTLAVPSTTPGEAPMPVTVSTSPCSMSSRSGKPQRLRYGNSSCDSVAVPIQSLGLISSASAFGPMNPRR